MVSCKLSILLQSTIAVNNNYVLRLQQQQPSFFVKLLKSKATTNFASKADLALVAWSWNFHLGMLWIPFLLATGGTSGKLVVTVQHLRTFCSCYMNNTTLYNWHVDLFHIIIIRKLLFVLKASPLSILKARQYKLQSSHFGFNNHKFLIAW